LQEGYELSLAASDRPSALLHSVPLPILGKVAAGRPFESSISGETLDVPRWFLDRGGDHFLLRVVGDSMIGEGIFEDDYVVIKKQESARNGQTVVASIDNEATIKKYYRKGNVVELHSANPKYPIFKFYLDRVSFRIEGVLNGVLRRFAGQS
jgi:repressor LexA